MRVFIISPKLTMKDIFYADEFNYEMVKQLREYGVEFYEINDRNIARCKTKIVKDSIIIVYNEHELEYKIIDEVQELLKKAIEENAQIWPVAIDKTARTPTGIISAKQSYDVWFKKSGTNCHGSSTASYELDKVFDIISKNHFNSNPEQWHCDKCKTYDWLNGSYITFVEEETFLDDPEKYINNAYDKSENDASGYDLVKQR